MGVGGNSLIAQIPHVSWVSLIEGGLLERSLFSGAVN